MGLYSVVTLESAKGDAYLNAARTVSFVSYAC